MEPTINFAAIVDPERFHQVVRLAHGPRKLADRIFNGIGRQVSFKRRLSGWMPWQVATRLRHRQSSAIGWSNRMAAPQSYRPNWRPPGKPRFHRLHENDPIVSIAIARPLTGDSAWGSFTATKVCSLRGFPYRNSRQGCRYWLIWIPRTGGFPYGRKSVSRNRI